MSAETVKNTGQSNARSHRPPRGLPLGPILRFLAVWLGGSWVIVGGWLSPQIGWGAVAAAPMLGILPIWTLIRGFQGEIYPGAAVRLWVLRPFWYVMLFLPMLAIVTLVGALAGLPFGAAGAGGRVALGLGAAVAAIAMIVGAFGARRLVVRHLEVRMPRLPAAFDGLRVAQISDLHVGPHTSRRFLTRVRRRGAGRAARRARRHRRSGRRLHPRRRLFQRAPGRAAGAPRHVRRGRKPRYLRRLGRRQRRSRRRRHDGAGERGDADRARRAATVDRRHRRSRRARLARGRRQRRRARRREDAGRCANRRGGPSPGAQSRRMARSSPPAAST